MKISVSLLAHEKARIERTRDRISKKKTELQQLQDAILSIEKSLVEARQSFWLNIALFVPSAVFTAIGGILVKVSLTPGSGAGVAIARFGAALFGFPAVAVFGTAGAITGYKVYLRNDEIGKFQEEISKLKEQNTLALRGIAIQETQIADSSRVICLLEDKVSAADCETEYQSEITRLGAAASK